MLTSNFLEVDIDFVACKKSLNRFQISSFRCSEKFKIAHDLCKEKFFELIKLSKFSIEIIYIHRKIYIININIYYFIFGFNF